MKGVSRAPEEILNIQKLATSFFVLVCWGASIAETLYIFFRFLVVIVVWAGVQKLWQGPRRGLGTPHT